MLYIVTYWRAFLALALIALYPVFYLKGSHDGNKTCQTATALATAKANESARETEKLRQRSVDVAVDKAAVREKGLLADAAGARRESASLRDDIARVQSAFQSSPASDNALRTVSELFQSCSERYSDVAQETDRAYSEVKTLRDSWPK